MSNDAFWSNAEPSTAHDPTRKWLNPSTQQTMISLGAQENSLFTCATMPRFLEGSSKFTDTDRSAYRANAKHQRRGGSERIWAVLPEAWRNTVNRGGCFIWSSCLLLCLCSAFQMRFLVIIHWADISLLLNTNHQTPACSLRASLLLM